MTLDNLIDYTLDNLIDYTLDNLIGVDKNASFLFFIKVTSILLQVLSNSTSRVLEVYKNKCKTQKIVQKYNLKIKKNILSVYYSACMTTVYAGV